MTSKHDYEPMTQELNSSVTSIHLTLRNWTAMIDFAC